jgi:tRNA(fMet)-specific endonuclease VapC
MLYLLDTDIASYIINSRSPQAAAKFAGIRSSQIAISAVTRAELLYGLKKVPPSHRLHSSVPRFLNTIRVLAWGAEAAGFYADIRHHLLSTGPPIGEMDMMIAAHALALGATLVTNNTRHYQRIQAPLLLENWAL